MVGLGMGDAGSGGGNVEAPCLAFLCLAPTLLRPPSQASLPPSALPSPAAANPELDNKALVKRLAEMWKELGADDKQEYEVRHSGGCNVGAGRWEGQSEGGGHLQPIAAPPDNPPPRLPSHLLPCLAPCQALATADKERYQAEVAAAGPLEKKPRAKVGRVGRGELRVVRFGEGRKWQCQHTFTHPNPPLCLPIFCSLPTSCTATRAWRTSRRQTRRWVAYDSPRACCPGLACR